jgi:hypothetical protein
MFAIAKITELMKWAKKRLNKTIFAKDQSKAVFLLSIHAAYILSVVFSAKIDIKLR